MPTLGTGRSLDQARKPLVVLTFDDAVSNHATLVAPLLQGLGFGATFYICEFNGGEHDNFAANQQQYMTWAQIEGLHRAGFEIGNHTLTHRSVLELNADELEAEVKALETRCSDRMISHPQTFAYPGGPYNDQAFSVLSSMRYRLARACGDRPYRPKMDHPLAVPSFVITGEKEALFYQALQQWQPGEVIVFTFHGMPEYTHPWVNTPPEMFGRMMRHLRSQGIRVMAMRDLLA